MVTIEIHFTSVMSQDSVSEKFCAAFTPCKKSVRCCGPIKLLFRLMHRWLHLFLKALEPVRTRESTLLHILKYELPSETKTK